MSESDSSPSVLNLKDFRIQKKSTFSHTPDINDSLDTLSLQSHSSLIIYE